MKIRELINIIGFKRCFDIPHNIFIEEFYSYKKHTIHIVHNCDINNWRVSEEKYYTYYFYKNKELVNTGIDIEMVNFLKEYFKSEIRKYKIEKLFI